MLTMNGVGEPCAGEPHVRLCVLEAEGCDLEDPTRNPLCQ